MISLGVVTLEPVLSKLRCELQVTCRNVGLNVATIASVPSIGDAESIVSALGSTLELANFGMALYGRWERDEFLPFTCSNAAVPV